MLLFAEKEIERCQGAIITLHAYLSLERMEKSVSLGLNDKFVRWDLLIINYIGGYNRESLTKGRFRWASNRLRIFDFPRHSFLD